MKRYKQFIKVCSIRNAYKLHNGKTILFGTRVSSKTKLIGFSNNKNFGNPFRVSATADKLNYDFKTNKYKGYGTAKEVSELYVEWIRGKVHQDIEPDRREWIFLNAINFKLHGKIFTYYKDVNTSHILSLLEYIYSPLLLEDRLEYNLHRYNN